MPQVVRLRMSGSLELTPQANRLVGLNLRLHLPQWQAPSPHEFPWHFPRRERRQNCVGTDLGR